MKESYILHIETATKACSVALSKGKELIAYKEEVAINYSHAEKLNVFIEEVLTEAGVKMNDLSAVAVSKGPGSFTGLRIGVASAKGICFALSIPLIATSTLYSLYEQLNEGVSLSAEDRVVAMIDARRREVYTQSFDHSGLALNEIHAEVIDATSFHSVESDRIHLVGDGAGKFEEEFKEKANILIHHPSYPSARFMVKEAWMAFEKGNFEDLAYFEPYYLKDFIAIKPRKIF